MPLADGGQTAVAILGGLTGIAILVLSTLGLVVIFGMMGVVNFAHGQFMMVGAYAALETTQRGGPLVVAIVVGAISTAIIGMIVERAVIRPLYDRLLDTLLATWALSLIMTQLIVVIFGPIGGAISIPFGSLSIGSSSVSVYSLVIVPVTAVLVGAVYLIFTRTTYGMFAQATTQNSEMASALGVNASRVNAATFALGAALAGTAGAILAPLFPVTPAYGLSFLTGSFMTVVVAGPVILSGTLVTAAGFGGTEQVFSYFFSSLWGQIALLVAAVVALRIWRNGLSANWRMRL